MRQKPLEHFQTIWWVLGSFFIISLFIGWQAVRLYHSPVVINEEAAMAAANIPGSGSGKTGSGPGKATQTGGVASAPDFSKADPYTFLDLIPTGKPAPDFNVLAADGQKVRLTQYRGKKNVVLVFYQGNFCHVCEAQLSNLQKHIADFQAQDAQLIAISADTRLGAETTLGEKGLSFLVVPDPEKVLINRYGVGNVSKHGIAWPSVYVIDKKGMIRLSYANSEGKRMHSSDILPVLSKITGKTAPKLGYDE